MNKIWSYIPTQLLFFYALGLALEYYVRLPISIEVCLVVLVLLLAFCRGFQRVFFLFYGVLIMIGVLSIKIRTPQYFFSKAYENEATRFELVVSEMLVSKNKASRFYGRLTRVDTLSISEYILVHLEQGSETIALKVGDRLRCIGRIQVIQPPKNPYDFDYRKFLLSKNIRIKTYVKRTHWSLTGSEGYLLRRYFAEWRKTMIAKLHERIPDKAAVAITAAMVLGQKKHIPGQLRKAYEEAGVVHVLAVSGLHVGVVVLGMRFILRPFRRLRYGKLFSLLSMLIVLWGFALLAGLSASVVRAVTMFSFVVIGLQQGSRRAVLESLVSAAFLLLVCSPFFLFDMGFHMSFIAVFSIVTLSPLLNSYGVPRRIMARYFWNLGSVSLSAQLGLLPYTLYHFHIFSGLFLLANVIVVPFIGVFLFLGFLVLLLVHFSNVPPIVFEVYSKLIGMLNALVQKLASFEAFVFSEVSFSFLKMLVCYAMFFVFLLCVQKRKVLGFQLVLIGILIFQAVSFGESYHLIKRKEWLVLNRYRTTIILSLERGVMRAQLSDAVKEKEYVKDCYMRSGARQILVENGIQKAFVVGDIPVLIVDKLGLYEVNGVENGIVVLVEGPQINMARLLKKIKPKYLVADGSSPYYMKKKWRETCHVLGVPFHDTSKEGAFVMRG